LLCGSRSLAQSSTSIESPQRAGFAMTFHECSQFNSQCFEYPVVGRRTAAAGDQCRPARMIAGAAQAARQALVADGARQVGANAHRAAVASMDERDQKLE